MPRFEAPPTVYKYLHSDRIDFFDCPCLRFTPIEELNDPFESLVSMHREESENFLFGLLRLAQVDMNSLLHSMLNAFSRTGVLSLTTDCTNLLMWSHYANNHRGLVFEFDSNNEFFKSLDAVVYSKDRLYFDEISESKNHKASLLYRSIYYKSLDWSYENEWRLFKIWIHKLPQIKEGVIGLVECPLESLKSIYLGMRASGELKIAATKFCRNHNHVKLYQAKLHPSNFELNFFEMPLE